MIKEDLIRLLKELEDGTDVLIWNNFVEDFQDISGGSACNLYKENLHHIYITLKYSEMKYKKSTDVDKRAIFKKALKKYHNQDFNLANMYPAPVDNWYDTRTKKVFILDVEKRGGTYFDMRGGMYDY